MTYQVQVAIPFFNGLPEDVSTNVLHFNWLGGGLPTEANMAEITDEIEQFYESIYLGAATWASYAQPLFTAKWYNLGGPVPRPPLYETTRLLTVSASGSDLLPSEVSVVASVHAAPTGGVPQARLRGRVYLGCLGNGVVEPGSVTAFPTVGEGFRTAVNGACNTLMTDSTVAGFPWVVFSRVQATGYPIIGGHCDDAFDTQRRRGQAPTIRNSWP